MISHTARRSFRQRLQERSKRLHRRDLQPFAWTMHIQRYTARTRLSAHTDAFRRARRTPGRRAWRPVRECCPGPSGVRPAPSRDVAGRFGLPLWVATGVLHFKPCQPEDRGYHASGRQLAALDNAAVAMAGLPSCRDLSSSPAVPSLPGSSSRHRRRCRWGIPRTCRLGEPHRGMHAWDHPLVRPRRRRACATSRTSIDL